MGVLQHFLYWCPGTWILPFNSHCNCFIRHIPFQRYHDPHKQFNFTCSKFAWSCWPAPNSERTAKISFCKFHSVRSEADLWLASCKIITRLFATSMKLKLPWMNSQIQRSRKKGKRPCWIWTLWTQYFKISLTFQTGGSSLQFQIREPTSIEHDRFVG